MTFHGELGTFLTSSRVLLASVVFVAGLFVGFAVGRIVRRFLEAIGLDRTVEGTTFERTAQGLGTSTVGVFSELVAIGIYLAAALSALHIAGLLETSAVVPFLAAFLPKVFVAILAIVAGLLVGDKAALLVGEKLRGVKLPEVGFIPMVVRYSVFYIAALIALGQLGVATGALVVLLAAYVFALIFLGGLAFRDLLATGAAGIYLLLEEPYSIGDEIQVGDRAGIVQEVDLFVTHVEEDGEEFIIPNREIFREGIVRIRE
jgi:small-conductance mechanosensitive channel